MSTKAFDVEGRGAVEEKNEPLKFWSDLSQRAKSIPGGDHFLSRLKAKFLEAKYSGEEVILLDGGFPYQQALEMLIADIEVSVCTKKLKHAEERRKLKGHEFWLAVLEETGFDEDADLVFDPLNLRILSMKTAKQPVSDSHKLSLDGYKDLVMAVLVNPLNASRMVSDPHLNFWEIKHMAQVITDGDFKPNLRKMIEQWVDDPAEARESKPVLIQEEMPGWLVEIATKLGQRRKWDLI